MKDRTSWTPAPDENKLGITDTDLINKYEAEGITSAELFILDLEVETILSVQLILKIHEVAFSKLYDWAGKWRTVSVSVGQLTPPEPYRILQLMYQFIDNLNYKLNKAKTQDEHLDCLVFAHYEFVKIHPFNNGNGRTGRLLMNIVALKLGYQPVELYSREGESRKIYINAMKAADNGDFELLFFLIRKELRPF